MPTRLSAIAILFVTLVSASGCGGTDFGDIGSIRGFVTHRGETPPTGTKVIFMQMETGYAGFGFTDAEGNYSIKWRREGKTYDGLPVGDYKVLVSPPGADQAAQSIEDLSADEMLDGADSKIKVEESPFDMKYSQTETSGIAFTIKAGENTCDIVLN